MRAKPKSWLPLNNISINVKKVIVLYRVPINEYDYTKNTYPLLTLNNELTFYIFRLSSFLLGKHIAYKYKNSTKLCHTKDFHATKS